MRVCDQVGSRGMVLLGEMVKDSNWMGFEVLFSQFLLTS